jgi:hypothetical protein
MVGFDGRSLQNVNEVVPESDSFCPIGSTIETRYVFNPATFTAEMEAEVLQVTDGLVFIGNPSFEVSVIDCTEETNFDSVLSFEFSAFEVVEENISHISGLGQVIAEIYNGLSKRCCDEFVRNSISLTYIEGSLRRTGVSAPVTNGGVRDRNVQIGCVNYAATFTVAGKCRGCLSLRSPIPLFGESTTSNAARKLPDTLLYQAFDEAERQQNLAGGSSFTPRRLQQEEESTCIFDVGSIKTAPTLDAVQSVIVNRIRGVVPWAENRC